MSLRYEFTVRVPVTPDRLWPYVSDTRRFNRAIGLAPWRFDSERDPSGDVRRTGRARFAALDVEWDEHPFEWHAPETHAVVRDYRNGPFLRMINTVRLTPNGDGTLISHVVEVEPRGVFGRVAAWWQIGQRSGPAMVRAYRAIAAFAATGQGVAFPEPRPRLSSEAHARLDRLERELGQRCPPAIAARLVEHVRLAPDLDVARVRPFALARAWQLDRDDVLRACLHAVRAGLLELSWDVLCPLCRGAKASGDSLSAVRSEAHCDSCRFDFVADFSRSLEVSFRPSPGVRPVDAVEYCVGGPGSTPHAVVQRRVAGGGTIALELQLPEGAFRVRGARDTSGLHLEVVAGGAASARFDGRVDGVATARVAPRFTLELVAPPDVEGTVFVVERAAWLDDAATAAHVTTLQAFRDLFAREALAPGERLSVGQLAFLFTDLKDSTALYSRVGDAPAFAAVRSHFEVLTAAVTAHRGAIVKTIGDAVMAAFVDPADAVAAALASLEGIDGLDAKGADGPLTIKLGVHAGPCLAVTLNERLDYFGTTVNVAARVQGESRGGDLVVSRAVAEDPSVAKLLASSAVTTDAFSAHLKGISGSVALVRISPGAALAKRAG